MLRGRSVPSANKLTLFEDSIYWTDNTRQGVIRTHQSLGSKTIKIIYQNRNISEKPLGIKAYHQLRQPLGRLRRPPTLDENPIGNVTFSFFSFSRESVWQQQWRLFPNVRHDQGDGSQHVSDRSDAHEAGLSLRLQHWIQAGQRPQVVLM